MRHFFQRLIMGIQELPSGLATGDQGWALLRLLCVLAVFAAFMCIMALSFEQDALRATAFELLVRYESLRTLPEPFIRFLAIFLSWQSLRYLIIPIAALSGALFLGARYILDIYEAEPEADPEAHESVPTALKSFSKALQYLAAAIFDLFYTGVVIEDGKPRVKPDEENLLLIIGGPGYMTIRPGSAVLLESLSLPSSVLAEGGHFVSRFDTIKQIASLEEQHGTIEKISAVTKDGVVVNIKDIRYIYRLLPGRRGSSQVGRTPERPYPHSNRAIYQMAYNRVVVEEARQQEGATVYKQRLQTWEETIRKAYEGEIQNYIRRNQVDQVTAPRNFEPLPDGQLRGDPRKDIHNIYRQPGFRNTFRRFGAELVWHGLGHFEVDNQHVVDQRVSTWQADWRGDARKILAYSDAKRQAYEEQGRAEAQAELLMGITHALEGVNVVEADRQRKLHEVFLLRVAQLLDALRDSGKQGTSAV